MRGEQLEILYTGKQIKELVNKHIADDDIVCVGEKNDKLGRYDRQVIGIEKRQIGFDDDNTYKAIVTQPFDSNGAMKFGRNEVVLFKSEC